MTILYCNSFYLLMFFFPLLLLLSYYVLGSAEWKVCIEILHILFRQRFISLLIIQAGPYIITGQTYRNINHKCTCIWGLATCADILDFILYLEYNYLKWKQDTVLPAEKWTCHDGMSDAVILVAIIDSFHWLFGILVC